MVDLLWFNEVYHLPNFLKPKYWRVNRVGFVDFLELDAATFRVLFEKLHLMHGGFCILGDVARKTAIIFQVFSHFQFPFQFTIYVKSTLFFTWGRDLLRKKAFTTKLYWKSSNENWSLTWR